MATTRQAATAKDRDTAQTKAHAPHDARPPSTATVEQTEHNPLRAGLQLENACLSRALIVVFGATGDLTIAEDPARGLQPAPRRPAAGRDERRRLRHDGR